jgi:hypothetical protein
MSLTLAQYRVRVAELLDDTANARYVTAQIDTALRAALIDYSTMRPILRTYMLDTTGDKVIDLPADFTAMQITRVQLWNNDPDKYINVKAFVRLVDEQWSVETVDTIYPTKNVLIVSYTDHQTIDSLDSAAGTTVDDDNLLAIGAAAYAAQSRAVSRAETINMQPALQKQLIDISTRYFNIFYNRLPLRAVASGIAFDDGFPEAPTH